MTCLMYYVPLTSTSMSTYGTCYGMILAILLVDIRLAIGLRLAYVAMAAVTAWTANRFLFPITEPGQVRDSSKPCWKQTPGCWRNCRKCSPPTAAGTPFASI